MKYLLGLDAGSTMCKAALFDTDGNQIAVAGRKQDVLSPHPGWREVNPEGMWKAAAGAIAEVLAQSGVAARDVLGLGASGAGNGVYAVDEAGVPVRNGMQSSDRRATDIVEEWTARGVPEASYPVCFQGKFPGEMAACLAWMKKHEPEAYRRIAHVFMVKDYVTYKLTGNFVSDRSDMSGTAVVDLKAGRYSRELVDLYGIPEMWSALPPMHESYDVVGQVTAEAARATGLLPGTPVVPGLHDMSACAVGSGAIQENDLVSLAGTLALNEVVLREPPASGFWTICYAVPGYFLSASGGGASALNLEWFVTTCCGEEKALAKERGISVYDVCNELVAGVSSKGLSVLFHPYVLGKGGLDHATAGFYGITSTTTKADLLRAVYEGVVFMHLDGMGLFEAAGITPKRAFLAGGGSKSTVWSQMFADAYSLPLTVAAGSEVGAHGAAMCAGIGTGVYADFRDAVAKAVTVERHHAPVQADTAVYRARHAQYLALNEALLEPWKGMAALAAAK